MTTSLSFDSGQWLQAECLVTNIRRSISGSIWVSISTTPTSQSKYPEFRRRGVLNPSSDDDAERSDGRTHYFFIVSRYYFNCPPNIHSIYRDTVSIIESWWKTHPLEMDFRYTNIIDPAQSSDNMQNVKTVMARNRRIWCYNSQYGNRLIARFEFGTKT